MSFRSGAGWHKRSGLAGCDWVEKKLSEMEYEEEGTITDIEGTLRKRVAGMGIRVGKRLKMITKQPVKGPVVVVVDEANTSLGLDIAEKIIVEMKS
ncbi:MAG: ferrous iron transport protein A [Methanosarcinales archaeon]|nr:ferrous iron transport protein A [Methanosarcinales archaeon]